MGGINSQEAGYVNLNNPMTKAIGDVWAYQRYVEKAELLNEDVGEFLKKANAGLYNTTTNLGKFLEGDGILVQTGLTKVTEDDPDLMHLAGLYFAGDALAQAENSLVEDSGLTLDQLHNAGDFIKDTCKDIAVNADIEPKLTMDGQKFYDDLNASLEEYRASGLLHKDAATVKAASKVI